MKQRPIEILLGLFFAAGVVALLTGCQAVSVQSTQYIGVPSYPPTDPASIQILRSEPTTANVRLGEITLEPSSQSTPAPEIEQKLRQAAAKMGANAAVVVADRTAIMGGVVTGPWWGRTVQPTYGRVVIAVAIRYTQ
jgi:hypothetical protein